MKNKKNDILVVTIIIGIGSLIGYYVLKTMSGLSDTNNSNTNSPSQNNDGDTIADEIVVKSQTGAETLQLYARTLASQQYYSIADKLYKAMNGNGTDEDEIFRLYGFVKTMGDINEIHKVFGIKDGMTVKQYIQSELDEEDLKKLDGIIKKNVPTVKIPYFAK